MAFRRTEETAGGIVGGQGGNSDDSYAVLSHAGNGGYGADLLYDDLVYNYGGIVGGRGGESIVGYGGNGGVGVYLSGSTLVNAGTIAGGYGGYGEAGSGTNGDAVLFGSTAATLIVDPGAMFYGAVVANTAVDDTLELAGTTRTHFSGLGSQFTGFTTVDVNSGASWILDGTNELTNSTTLNVEGRLVVHGGLWDQGIVDIDTHGVLRANGLFVAHSVNLDGGRLRVGNNGRIVIGSNGTTGVTGEIMIDAGSNIVGYGTINGPVADEGWISAEDGKLTIKDSVTGGGGMIYIHAGATLFAQGSLAVGGIEFVGHDDSLILGNNASLDSPIDWFGWGDSIKLYGIHASTESFSGNTLSLYHGTTLVDAITFNGSYNSADFALSHANGATIISWS